MDFEERLVSGAPERTYRQGESLFEYRGAVMDQDRAAAAGIQYLFELYGAAYYRHTPNPDMIVDGNHPWSAELIQKYLDERHCHAAASVVLRIDDAVVEGSVIQCLKDNRTSILYESFRFPDRLGSAPPPPSLDLPFAGFQRKRQAYLYLGSLGSSNYGHWLVDDLPRARAWLELRRKLGITCIIVIPAYGSRIDKIRVRSLQALIHPRIKVRFIPPDQACRLSNLYYVTPVSFHPRIKTPAAIEFVRSRAIACLRTVVSDPTERLFIARRPPHSRAIANFEETWALLAARGFRMVEPEGLDFLEQVALFRKARIVVGQMGAAMTNTLFCHPATSLIYLAPLGWTEPFYLDLAALGGQQYNILFGPPTDHGPPHLSDFTVPVAHLDQRLTYMGFTDITAGGSPKPSNHRRRKGLPRWFG